MEENNVMTKEQLQEDYSNVYVKKVHLIGRATMAIAFILMFAPVLYMHFVAGFTAPADAYMACAAAACAAGVGGWIAEPISYFPGGSRNLHVLSGRQCGQYPCAGGSGGAERHGF